MEATVKPDAKWRTIRACAGAEFTKGEWRRVPAGTESEAERNEYLDVRPDEAEVRALLVAEMDAHRSEGLIEPEPDISADIPPDESGGNMPSADEPTEPPKRGKKGRAS